MRSKASSGFMPPRSLVQRSDPCEPPTGPVRTDAPVRESPPAGNPDTVRPPWCRTWQRRTAGDAPVRSWPAPGRDETTLRGSDDVPRNCPRRGLRGDRFARPGGANERAWGAPETGMPRTAVRARRCRRGLNRVARPAAEPGPARPAEERRAPARRAAGRRSRCPHVSVSHAHHPVLPCLDRGASAGDALRSQVGTRACRRQLDLLIDAIGNPYPAPQAAAEQIVADAVDAAPELGGHRHGVTVPRRGRFRPRRPPTVRRTPPC